MGISDNYAYVKQKIEDTAVSSNRNPGDISIIAVCKTFSADIVQDAIDNGITLLGENKIQEARNKIPALRGNFSVHLVGHLQSNKAKYAVRLFDCVHSIDKFSTAQKLNEEAKKAGRTMDILVQVNTSGESSKFGVSPVETEALCRQIFPLENLSLKGLMTIGPNTDNHDSIRRAFRQLRELRDEINKKTEMQLKDLSMGMSNDYLIAVEEGATMVRIGSSIFGTRSYT
ncbi:MAG: YggS family pyridoxal phosphate-dependent enzyme [Spirochaetota bacterium]